MVAPAGQELTLNLSLEALALMMDDLPGMADDWDNMTDAEQVSWSLDWDQVMGAVRATLSPAYCDGRMTPDQQTRYRTLLAGLREALPLIRQLNLTPPTVSLDAAA